MPIHGKMRQVGGGRPGALPLDPTGAVGPRPHFVGSETGIRSARVGRGQGMARTAINWFIGPRPFIVAGGPFSSNSLIALCYRQKLPLASRLL